MNETIYDYTILFIEDDEVARKNYVEVLKENFYQVYEADNGIQAYEIYLEKKPDILIVDVDIPKMNGLELLKKIRKFDINTKAILFTSFSDKETMLEASVLKLTKYLIKPVNRKELFEALDNAVRELKDFTVISNKILQLKENYYWDFSKKELFFNKTIIDLTRKENEILDIIFTNGVKNKVTTYDDLLYELWYDHNESNIKSLKTFISSIRKKLPKNTILNEYGVGYKLALNDI